MNFIKEESRVFLNTLLHSNKHISSGLRLIIVPISGPLVSLNILIPTPTSTNKGVPHCLEHLIFCGSRAFPNRGFLDNMATRNLSAGTNAYTAEDHTAYQITTAGVEAMMNVLPVFLDHVLHPTLESNAFTTEVHHLDSSAKHNGVVFNEMKGRENSEQDLMDINIRRLLFSGLTTYSFESGGQTPDISILSNQECIDFHKELYNHDNLTIILMGANLNAAKIFEAIESQLHDSKKSIKPDFINPPKLEAVSKKLKFPSSDIETGSIGYGWRGPSDIETRTALEVFMLFLTDTTSSPFNQTFVEIQDPIASDVDVDFKSFYLPCFVVYFSGVPFCSNKDESDGSESESIVSDEDSEMSATSLDDESIIADGYYFEDGILSEKLDKFFASVLLTLDESPNIVLEKIKRTIERHIRKIHQSLEDDPHEFLSSLLPSDIIKQGYDHDHKIGSWGTLIDDVEALSDKPIEYWKKLFLEYIISPPRVELMMIPDIELSKSMSDEEVRLDLERQKQYGEEGLKKLSKTLDDAVSANKVDLPRHVIDTMPPIPSTREIAKLQKKVDIEATNCILSRVIVVKTETRFSHLRLFIGLDGLSKNLLPYLVLFQEMLFESGVRDLSYTDVVDKTADLCVNHEAAIGVGCQSSKFQESLSHLIDVLANSIFEADRILTIAKNILSELVESKRNASVIMTAVTTRMTRSDVDLAINIFTQQEFLQNLIQEIKSNPTKTIKALNEIQLFMMNGMSSMGFAQVSLPLDSPFSSSQVQKILSESWETGVESFRSRNQIRKRDRVAIQQNPFPFPRKSYSIDKIDAKFGKSVMVQVPGLQNSTLGQFIECDLLTSDIRDQVAVMVLCELLSRMEGPIFTAIRGNGLAYGCHVDAFVWSGQLHFEVSSSSEPQKALAAWYKILEDLSSAEGFSEICSDFNIETAKSMSMYSLCASKSTASGNIINVLRETLRGMSFEMENLVEGITAQDLRRVFDGYFVKFRNPEDRVTVLVTGTMGGSEVCESFKEVQVEMRMIDLDEFKKND